LLLIASDVEEVILGSPYRTVQVVKKMLGILCKP
jgi:hypothetical protein